ncbi:type II toxin-antitoxin system RelE/ParE family toxin [Pseudomonas migulae]|jgi:toxin ParE1/3/4|uniref:type II toxin-antitoxin system RelE/ParE family toxin n=1 Tax=Pseudomonas migulae TaxID=78543 RepID=UPI003711B73E
MRQLKFAAMAREDLQQIARFIAKDSPVRARSFIGEIRTLCERLVDQPEMGVSQEDYAKGLRRISHGSYLIFYSRVQHDILIERVLHSARDIGRQFDTSAQD